MVQQKVWLSLAFFRPLVWILGGPGIYQPDFMLNLNGGHRRSTVTIKSTPHDLGMLKRELSERFYFLVSLEKMGLERIVNFQNCGCSMHAIDGKSFLNNCESHKCRGCRTLATRTRIQLISYYC